MKTAAKYLTIRQAAIAADVSIAEINRMIDKRIRPNVFCKTSRNRALQRVVCLWIAFSFEMEDVLTSSVCVSKRFGTRSPTITPGPN
jgi:hypothetical protein